MTVLRVGRHMTIPPITNVQTFAPKTTAAGVDWSVWFDHLWIAKGAASLAASYVDRVGTTTLTEGVTPTLVAGGWLFGGTYLKTGLVPNGDWMMMVQYVGGGDPSGTICGTNLATAPRFTISPNTSGWAGRVQYGYNSVSYVAPQLAAGNLCIAGATAYRNGASDGALSAWSGTNAIEIGIGSGGDGSGAWYGGPVVAVGLKATTLSAAAVAAAMAAMAAL